jgi:hypothetical protein
MKKEIGIVTKTEFSQVVDDFLAAEQWRPSPDRIALQELHQQFLSWLAKQSIPFSIPQRLFCILLIERGFRAAYANIRVGEEWRFRKIVFAGQESVS